MMIIAEVNFINILCTRFVYHSKLSCFSLVIFGFVIFLSQNIGEKCTCKNVDEIDTCSAESKLVQFRLDPFSFLHDKIFLWHDIIYYWIFFNQQTNIFIHFAWHYDKLNFVLFSFHNCDNWRATSKICFNGK